MIKFNLWLIPKDASKPADERRKKTSAQNVKEAVAYSKAMDDLCEQRQNMNIRSFQSLHENNELFMEIVKHFPYPMHISEPDGTIFFAEEIMKGKNQDKNSTKWSTNMI